MALAVVLNKCAMMDAHLFDEKIPLKIVKSSIQGEACPLIGFFEIKGEIICRNTETSGYFDK